MPIKRQSGFTLIEIMVTLAVTGILLSIAVPSLNSFFDKRRLIEGTEAIYSEIQLARSESVARSSDIHIEFVTDGGENWDFGISEAADCTVTILNPTTANACFLEIDDGDGVSGEDDDKVLKLVRHDDHEGVRMIAASFAGNSNDITFDSVRGTAETGSIRLESDSGLKLRVDVTALGRVKICSPAGIDHVAGYESTGCTNW